MVFPVTTFGIFLVPDLRAFDQLVYARRTIVEGENVMA
jgi:hypothetical protein